MPPARILIVDDNALVRQVVRRLVTSQGWEVCAEAANGQEAVEIVQALPPDLVIMDFMMPVKDGLQTAREILNIRPTLPIVLNTLYLTEQLRALAQELACARSSQSPTMRPWWQRSTPRCVPKSNQPRTDPLISLCDGFCQRSLRQPAGH